MKVIEIRRRKLITSQLKLNDDLQGVKSWLLIKIKQEMLQQRAPETVVLNGSKMADFQIIRQKRKKEEVKNVPNSR